VYCSKYLQRTPWNRDLREKLTVAEIFCDILCLVLKLRCHYYVHKFLPLIHILSQMNPFHITRAYFLTSVSFLSFYVCLGLPNSTFPSGFPIDILYASLIFPMRATYHVHLIVLHSIIITTSGEEDKLWNFILQFFVSLSYFFFLGSEYSQHRVLEFTIFWFIAPSSVVVGY